MSFGQLILNKRPGMELAPTMPSSVLIPKPVHEGIQSHEVAVFGSEVGGWVGSMIRMYVHVCMYACVYTGRGVGSYPQVGGGGRLPTTLILGMGGTYSDHPNFFTGGRGAWPPFSYATDMYARIHVCINMYVPYVCITLYVCVGNRTIRPPDNSPLGQLAPGQLAPGQLAPGQLVPGQLAPGQLAPRTTRPRTTRP